MRRNELLASLALVLLAPGCTGTVEPGPGGDAATLADASGPDAAESPRDAGVRDSGGQASDAARVDAGVAVADAGAGVDAAASAIDASAPPDAGPVDPCPSYPIPATCNGRSVVYREWGPDAKGDGSYFADQAPGRLGFNRLNGEIWIVKVALEANSYLGTISAYGDNVGGTAWITDKPCDATFGVERRLVVYGNQGGGAINFVVVRDEADAQKLATDPTLKGQWGAMPQLSGGHCYYAEFENTDYPATAVTADFLATSADPCGNANVPSCYYLAFDFAHYLHDPTSGVLIQGRVIPGLTH